MREKQHDMAVNLLDKYNVPAPRYTSYPTVPYWQAEPPTQAEWIGAVQDAFRQNDEISLYIHLPYCERLCTYCGCNKRITRNHAVEGPYVDDLLREWELYCQILPGRPVIREIHLGGGTPTFFSPRQLRRLIEGILERADVSSRHEFGFEAHPNSTTPEHLATLYELGFRRLSIGVQDLDDEILELINRQQTIEDVERVTRQARALGYTSINYDLIFGLPRQTEAHIRRDMAFVAEWLPERLAFYSYAHVPWIKPSQRAYSEADLPKGKEKRKLYELGRQLLEAAGYVEIGMDHFARKSDSLYRAMSQGILHRNFMGYTPLYTRLSIGLGASAIGDTWTAFMQNEKHVEDWQARVRKGEFPIMRGHLLSGDDLVLRRHILNIMCAMETEWHDQSDTCVALFEGLARMEELVADGLVVIEETEKGGRLRVTPQGRPFLRNICLALDAHYWARQPQGQLFSQVV